MTEPPRRRRPAPSQQGGFRRGFLLPKQQQQKKKDEASPTTTTTTTTTTKISKRQRNNNTTTNNHEERIIPSPSSSSSTLLLDLEPILIDYSKQTNYHATASPFLISLKTNSANDDDNEHEVDKKTNELTLGSSRDNNNNHGLSTKIQSNSIWLLSNDDHDNHHQQQHHHDHDDDDLGLLEVETTRTRITTHRAPPLASFLRRDDHCIDSSRESFHLTEQQQQQQEQADLLKEDDHHHHRANNNKSLIQEIVSEPAISDSFSRPTIIMKTATSIEPNYHHSSSSSSLIHVVDQHSSDQHQEPTCSGVSPVAVHHVEQQVGTNTFTLLEKQQRNESPDDVHAPTTVTTTTTVSAETKIITNTTATTDSTTENEIISALSRPLSLLLAKLQPPRRKQQPPQQPQQQEPQTDVLLLLVQEFLQEHVTSPAREHFVWNYLLERVTLPPKRTNSTSQRATLPCLIMAKILLRQRVSSLVPFFLSSGGGTILVVVDDDDKKRRVLALHATIVLEASLQDVFATNYGQVDVDRYDVDDDDDDRTFLTDLLQYILPRLVDMVSPKRRTVLAQQCLQASYATIHTAVYLLSSSTATATATITPPPSSLSLSMQALFLSLWKATTCSLRQLLQVHCSWTDPSSPTALVANASHIASSSNKNNNVATNNSRSDKQNKARKACMSAVLVDWQQQLREHERRLEHFICEKEMASDEAMIRVCESWCVTLAGVQVDGISNTTIGCLHQTLISLQTSNQFDHDKRIFTAKDMRRCLQAAKEDQSENQQHQHALLRGIAAWFGHSKRHGEEIMRETPTVMADYVAILMSLLNSRNAACASLVSSILDLLWCDTNGLPPDICLEDDSVSSHDVSSSFQILVDQLKTDNADANPTSPAICLLTARCIQVRGEPFLDYLLSKNGMRSGTIDVLICIINKNGEPRTALVKSVGQHLLDNIATNSHLRSKIKEDNIALFTSLEMEVLVSKLFDLLQDSVAGHGKSEANDIAAVTVLLLTNAMATSLGRDLEKFLSLVFDKLSRMIEMEEAKASPGNQPDKWFTAFGGSWRRYLVGKAIAGRDGFAVMLAAISRLAFRQPGNTTPLKLLGAVVGQGIQANEISFEEKARYSEAAAAIIKECVQQLDACAAEGDSTSKEEDSQLLRRLSPLFCLRRIPIGYFQLLLRDITTFSSNSELLELFKSLAMHIRERFQNRFYTSNERRLAAEIAGQCLPFTRSNGNASIAACSSFHLLYVPAIEQFHKGFDSRPTSENELIGHIRTAGAALYMVCHGLPHIGGEVDSRDAILFTASFALEVFGIELSGDPADRVDEEIVHVQTGCIEFLAVCIDTCARHRISPQPADSRHQPALPALVEELNADKNCCDPPAVANGSNTKSLAQIWRALVDIAADGYSKERWIRSTNERSDLQSSEPVIFSAQAQTCVWDAFIIIAQRSAKGGQLELIAETTMSWIVDWANHANNARQTHHPLCMAAALQVAFTLITRTKSFDFWKKEERQDKIRKVHLWAVQSVRSVPSNVDNYASGAVRMAGLKLMLAVVTIDQIDGCRMWACLAPGEIGEAFSVLRGVANLDRDPQVRQLAGQVLGTMSSSVI